MACNDCSINPNNYNTDQLFTWCTNCGNYGINAAVRRALAEECILPKDVLLCFDIGCHGNGSDKIEGYKIHGLHGRVLPLASGAALANQKVKVLAFGGDGGTLSEGINHLIHTVRSNYDFTFILHDNSNYGLTTGQASSTTRQNIPMNSSPDGVSADTLNSMELVLALNPSFVARGFSGNIKQLTRILREGIKHKGFSYIEVLQSCPTYNKATTHEWYMDRVYDVNEDPGYNVNDWENAKKIALDLENKIATGIIYKSDKLDFYSRQKSREGTPTELVDEVKRYEISKFLEELK